MFPAAIDLGNQVKYITSCWGKGLLARLYLGNQVKSSKDQAKPNETQANPSELKQNQANPSKKANPGGYFHETF